MKATARQKTETNLFLLLAAAGLLTLTACPPESQVECRRQSECAANQTCEWGYCITQDAGTNMGGGTGGGTGGGPMGGGGNPPDGGGGGTTCVVACEAWQQCENSLCQNLSIAIEAPTPNSGYGTGASVRLTARVTKPDGSPYAIPSIPASGSTGVTAPTSLTGLGGGLYQGDFALPATVGIHTVTAA